jgi:chorismate-pyruvate lyase
MALPPDAPADDEESALLAFASTTSSLDSFSRSAFSFAALAAISSGDMVFESSDESLRRLENVEKAEVVVWLARHGAFRLEDVETNPSGICVRTAE